MGQQHSALLAALRDCHSTCLGALVTLIDSLTPHGTATTPTQPCVGCLSLTCRCGNCTYQDGPVCQEADCPTNAKEEELPDSTMDRLCGTCLGLNCQASPGCLKMDCTI